MSFSFNFYNDKNIIYKGFSDKSLSYCNNCIKELNLSGIEFNKNICFLKREEGVFSLYYSIKRLGFLSKENDGTDISFKKLIYLLHRDVGDFYCVVFPCYVDWYPYSNRLVVFKTKESFESIYNNLLNSVIVLAYDSRRRPLDIPKILDNEDFSEKRIKSMIALGNCNESKLSNVLGKQWGIIKDDFSSMVFINNGSKTPEYIEVFL